MDVQSPLGISFLELPEVDSTNNYAMGMVHAGMAQHGMAVFAHAQNGGRGQRGKAWISEPGSNIALSLLIEPRRLAPTEAFFLSMAIALGTHRFCEAATGAPFTIKWPNDLYWGDRKAAGILIENLWQGPDWRWAIAGIGINVNQLTFGELADKATSFRAITGREEEPAALARELCTHLEWAWQWLLRRPGEIPEAFNALLYKKGERVRLRKGSRSFEALIRRVTGQGELVVEHGVEEQFAVGEVEWVGRGSGQ